MKLTVSRPAGLGLAYLGLPFHRHHDPRVHEVHSGISGQKISVSAAGGSFNPCARPFGPFNQTNLKSIVSRQCEDVTSLLDQRHITVCRGARQAGPCLSFSQFRLIFGILSPESTTHPKLVELVRNNILVMM